MTTEVLMCSLNSGL